MQSNPLVLVVLLLAVTGAPFVALAGSPTTSGGELEHTIAMLDGSAFDAFNHCDDPEQLRKHASYFAPDVEFYHDNGGVTWTRDAMIANTASNVCGKITRKLVAGSLKVYPVREFGAIAQGVHTFCPVGSSKCDGMADFVMVWQQINERWQITRVLSYGHRAVEPEQ